MSSDAQSQPQNTKQNQSETKPGRPRRKKKSKSRILLEASTIAAILTALIGAVGAGAGVIWKGIIDTQLERQKFESSLVLLALDAPTLGEKARYLTFLADGGLISNLNTTEIADLAKEPVKNLPRSTKPEVVLVASGGSATASAASNTLALKNLLILRSQYRDEASALRAEMSQATAERDALREQVANKQEEVEASEDVANREELERELANLQEMLSASDAKATNFDTRLSLKQEQLEDVEESIAVLSPDTGAATASAIAPTPGSLLEAVVRSIERLSDSAAVEIACDPPIQDAVVLAYAEGTDVGCVNRKDPRKARKFLAEMILLDDRSLASIARWEAALHRTSDTNSGPTPLP